MNLRNAAGGLTRFAHLIGQRPLKAEGDKPEDEEKRKDDAAEDDDEKKDDENKKDSDARADDGEDDDVDAEEGDDDEEPKKKDDDAKKARAAERARCAAIFAAPEAAGNVALAAQLAFETDMPSKQAIGILRAAGATAPRVRGLNDRMAGVKPIKVGSDDAYDPPANKAEEAKAQASRVLAAARSAGAKF